MQEYQDFPEPADTTQFTDEELEEAKIPKKPKPKPDPQPEE